jgi:hypothetical protein
MIDIEYLEDKKITYQCGISIRKRGERISLGNCTYEITSADSSDSFTNALVDRLRKQTSE